MQVICPTRQITAMRVQPHLQKYFCSLPTQITGLFRVVSSLTMGRWPSSQTLGWDAVDADALLTNSADRGRRSRVVLTPRRWRQACGYSQVTVTIKPVTGESTKETVKTIAQETPGVPVNLW
jgi:hypothetical protein